jgi:hypothetical protein
MIAQIIENKIVVNFSIRESNFCSLVLSGGYSITTESVVRFVGKNDNFICAHDHGHKFGLNRPFDAESKLKELLQNQSIRKVDLNIDTGDLNLFLDSGIFQIICDSSGYECYQINGPKNFIIIVHGGKQK